MKLNTKNDNCSFPGRYNYNVLIKSRAFLGKTVLIFKAFVLRFDTIISPNFLTLVQKQYVHAINFILIFYKSSKFLSLQYVNFHNKPFKSMSANLFLKKKNENEMLLWLQHELVSIPSKHLFRRR